MKTSNSNQVRKALGVLLFFLLAGANYPVSAGPARHWNLSLPDDLPFDPLREELYSAAELMKGFNPNNPNSYSTTPDWTSYQSRTNTNYGPLFSLHDFAMSQALMRYLNPSDGEPRKVVSILGGHDLPRLEKITNAAGMLEDSTYMQVALLAQTLARNHFTIATGGGPGAMEAGNLGAWFADRSTNELRAAVKILEKTSTHTLSSGEWLATAYLVMNRFPRNVQDPRTESVGVPTWTYGFEPPNPFASHIAKYFDNSPREDRLLAIATHGLIFAKGKAGTVQEVFQAACQNYYHSYHTNSVPMVLFGSTFWNRAIFYPQASEDKTVWPLLQELASESRYPFINKVRIMDDGNEVANYVITN